MHPPNTPNTPSRPKKPQPPSRPWQIEYSTSLGLSGYAGAVLTSENSSAQLRVLLASNGQIGWMQRRQTFAGCYIAHKWSVSQEEAKRGWGTVVGLISILRASYLAPSFVINV